MPRLTKEQKKALKEAKKLEKLRLAELARKEFVVKQLEREMKAQARIRDELNKKWKDLVMKMKEPVFRQDIEVMWHVFERANDQKDFLVQHVSDLIREADMQYQRSVANVCDTIDTMIDKFNKDLEEMSVQNEQRTKALLEEGREDAEKMATDQTAAETHLHLLIYHDAKLSEDLKWKNRGDNLVRIDEQKDRWHNERENLRSLLENDYANTWEAFKQVMKSYIEQTAESRLQGRQLRKKENIMSDVIANQAKKLVDNVGVIKRLRAEAMAYETGTKQAVFRERRQRYRSALEKLKKDLTDGQALDMEQLAKLVSASHETLTWLESAHSKGEKILRLAGQCRRFETLKEKVLPFSSRDTEFNRQRRESRPRALSLPPDTMMALAIRTNLGLDRLWQRIARADIIRAALEKEKEYLTRENEMLENSKESYKDMRLKERTFRCMCDETCGSPFAQDCRQIYKYMLK